MVQKKTQIKLLARGRASARAPQPTVSQITTKWFRLRERYETKQEEMSALEQELDNLADDLQEYGITVARTAPIPQPQPSRRSSRRAHIEPVTDNSEIAEDYEDQVAEDEERAAAASVIKQAPIKSGPMTDSTVADLQGNLIPMGSSGEEFAARIVGTLQSLQAGLGAS